MKFLYLPVQHLQLTLMRDLKVRCASLERVVRVVAQRSFISQQKTWRSTESWNMLSLDLAPAQFVAGWLLSPWERRKYSESEVLASLFQPTCSSSMWGLAFPLPGIHREPASL